MRAAALSLITGLLLGSAGIADEPTSSGVATGSTAEQPSEPVGTVVFTGGSIAEDGDYLIGFSEVNLGLVPGAGGTQRLPRAIGTPAALMHILMCDPHAPREAARLGLVHETVSGKALDRALQIARRLSSRLPESLAYAKRRVRNATETPLGQGLALERNLFLKLCVSDPALARMRSYERMNITSPSRSIEV